MSLVKYHNDVNTLKLGSFGEKELDVFFSILFKMRDRGTEELVLEYKELHKLADTSGHNKRMYSYIRGLEDKLLDLRQEILLPDGAIRKFNLFEYVDKKEDWDFIRVKITETFSYMLNDLIGNYTKFDLENLVDLNSGYSKQLFKLLKQYEGKGECFWYWEELDKFKELLGVPETYSTTNFNKKVLKPIEKELSVIFENFKITKLAKDGKEVGRGRKTHSLKFTWEKKRKVPKIEPITYKYGQQPKQNQGVNTKDNKKEGLKSNLREADSKLTLYRAEIEEIAKSQYKNKSILLEIMGFLRASKTVKEIESLVLKYSLNKSIL